VKKGKRDVTLFWLRENLPSVPFLPRNYEHTHAHMYISIYMHVLKEKKKKKDRRYS
jgi:hypothetical protein